MFIGCYELDKRTYNNIYYKNSCGFREWQKDTFSPDTEKISILDFTIKGKTYNERKANLEDIAKKWQLEFSGLSWSCGELAEVENWLFKNAKRYGLVKEFKENAVI